MARPSLAAAAAVALALLVPAALRAEGPGAGDPARGERVFQRCYACHSVDPGEKARLQGPSLYRVVGRRAASIADFDYSDAMRAKGSQGLVWDAATLDAYVADPDAVVPGTRMAVPPLREAQDRVDLIAYLIASGMRK